MSMRREESKCMIYHMTISLPENDHLVLLHWYFLFTIVNSRILLYKKHGLNHFFHSAEDSIDFGRMKGSVTATYTMSDVCTTTIPVELFQVLVKQGNINRRIYRKLISSILLY